VPEPDAKLEHALRLRQPMGLQFVPPRTEQFGSKMVANFAGPLPHSGSQVQILPRRPAFPTIGCLRGMIWGTKSTGTAPCETGVSGPSFCSDCRAGHHPSNWRTVYGRTRHTGFAIAGAVSWKREVGPNARRSRCRTHRR